MSLNFWKRNSAAYTHKFRTEPVKFIVGCEKEEFFVQPDFVSGLSDHMDTLIRSGVKGPDWFCVTWDIEVDIFVRLVQFVYTGSYTSLVGNRDKDNGIDIWPESGPFASQAFKLPYSLTSYELKAKTWAPNEVLSHYDSCSFKGARKRKLDAVSCHCGPSETCKSSMSAFMSTYIHGRGHLFR